VILSRVILPNAILLSVINSKKHSVVCNSTKRHSVKFNYAKRHSDECGFAKAHDVECHSAKRHSNECQSAKCNYIDGILLSDILLDRIKLLYSKCTSSGRHSADCHSSKCRGAQTVNDSCQSQIQINKGTVTIDVLTFQRR
jgi:hypothetical protein